MSSLFRGSVNEARRGEGGRGDSRGSAANVEFAASRLNAIAGLIDRLLSALDVGTPKPDPKETGPKPSPNPAFCESGGAPREGDPDAPGEGDR